MAEEQDGPPDFAAIAKELNETLKSDSIRQASEDNTSEITGRISTGITPLDALIGGGWPMGRYSIVAGWEAQGKSTLLELAYKSVQDMGGIGILADSDKAFSRERAAQLGVDVERLLIIEEHSVEKIFDVVYATATKTRARMPNTPILFGWDSVAASPTEVDLATMKNEKERWSQGMAVKPRALRDGFRKLTHMIASTKMCVILTNHLIASMDPRQPSTMPGGTALRFWSTLTLFIRSKGKIYNPDEQHIGNESAILVKKTRLCPPNREIIAPLYFDRGFDNDYAMFVMLTGSEKEALAGTYPFYRKGAWCHYIHTDGTDKSFYAKNLTSVLDEFPGSREFLAAKCYELVPKLLG